MLISVGPSSLSRYRLGRPRPEPHTPYLIPAERCLAAASLATGDSYLPSLGMAVINVEFKAAFSCIIETARMGRRRGRDRINDWNRRTSFVICRYVRHRAFGGRMRNTGAILSSGLRVYRTASLARPRTLSARGGMQRRRRQQAHTQAAMSRTVATTRSSASGSARTFATTAPGSPPEKGVRWHSSPGSPINRKLATSA